MQLRTRKDKGRGLAKKGGVVGSGGGAPIRSAAEAVASLPVRRGGMGDFGRDGVRWEGGRRSLRSLAAGAGMDGSVRWTVGAAGGGARCPPEVVVIRCF